MSINTRTYRLDSYKFYPRPNHFKKRLDSLVPRFKNVVGAFDEPFHDQKCLQNIDESYNRMSKPIVVSLTGDESQKFDIGRVVVVEADEMKIEPDPFSPSTLQSAGMFITVCYIAVKNTGEQSKATVRRHVDNFISLYGKHPELYETVFVFCEFPARYECSESETSSFRAYINKYALKKSAQWPGPSRIVFGPDHVTLGSLISDFIEENCLNTFHLMYEYLDRFIYKKDSPGAEYGNMAHVKEVENALYSYVRNDIDLADMRKQMLTLKEETMADLKEYSMTDQTVDAMADQNEDSRTDLKEDVRTDLNEDAMTDPKEDAMTDQKVDARTDQNEDSITEAKRFVDLVIVDLAKKLKCVLVGPLSSKLGLKIAICNNCLETIFENILRKHLSESSERHLKKLHEISKDHEKIIQEVKTGDHKLKKGNYYMILRLQNDLSAALNEVETELKKAVRQISIMGKMQFEIEGYFRVAGKPIGELQAKVPVDLQKDLLKIAGVVGAGTIYGKLEVHVKDSIQITKVKKEIDYIISKHNYAKQFVVRNVTKEAQQLATVQHGHGDIIKSPWPGKEDLREGTLGIFAEDQNPNIQGTKDLYALTCAHVVDPGKNDEIDVLVPVDDLVLKKIGVSRPELTVKTGSVEGARLIDIAAVKIEPEVQMDCLKKVKNEDGSNASSCVQDCMLQDLEKQIVYKFGAKSHFTRGIVCSTDYLAENNMDIYPDYILIIDSLQGSNESFAQPGDSGSLVCAPSFDSDRPVGSVAIVAMLTAGEMTVEGHATNLFLTFQYSKGLETLMNETGLHLVTLC